MVSVAHSSFACSDTAMGESQGIKKLVLGKRYETFSMHHLLQGISADDIPWLHASTGDLRSRVNVSEHVKRRRLVEELLFWLYDGFVIPLIRVRSSDYRQ